MQQCIPIAKDPYSYKYIHTYIECDNALSVQIWGKLRKKYKGLSSTSGKSRKVLFFLQIYFCVFAFLLCWGYKILHMKEKKNNTQIVSLGLQSEPTGSTVSGTRKKNLYTVTSEGHSSSATHNGKGNSEVTNDSVPHFEEPEKKESTYMFVC